MKTAVEWFNEEIKELFNQYQNEKISESMLHFNRLLALNQAKEMEKKQNKAAYKRGQRHKKPLKDSNPITKYLK
jgi:glutamyl-tRNA reductase